MSLWPNKRLEEARRWEALWAPPPEEEAEPAECGRCGREISEYEDQDFGGECVRCYDTDSPR